MTATFSRRYCSSDMAAVLTPPHSTSPEVGRSSPAIRDSRVVLPLPERPTTAWSRPASKQWLMPFRASTFWYCV